MLKCPCQAGNRQGEQVNCKLARTNKLSKKKMSSTDIGQKHWFKSTDYKTAMSNMSSTGIKERISSHLGPRHTGDR